MHLRASRLVSFEDSAQTLYGGGGRLLPFRINLSCSTEAQVVGFVAVGSRDCNEKRGRRSFGRGGTGVTA